MRQMDGTEQSFGIVHGEITDAITRFIAVALERGYVLPFYLQPIDADGDIVCRMRFEDDQNGGFSCVDISPPDEVAKLARLPVEMKLTDANGRKGSMTVDAKLEGHAA